MNGKEKRILFITVILCVFIYCVAVAQLNNVLISLNVQVTDLDEQHKIILSENASIISSIKTLLSMDNLNRIAREKNFTSNKGRIVTLKLEDDQAEEK